MEKDFTLILNSNLFDAEYYAKQTGTEFSTLPDAISHYVSGGWEKKYNPYLLFDSYGFLLQIGLKLNKNPGNGSVTQKDEQSTVLLPNDELVELAIEKLKKNEISPLEHYLKIGWLKGLKPHPLFDEVYYISQFKDLCKDENLLSHFATTGYKKNVSPHPLFDPVYYGKQNPKLDVDNYFLHYLKVGNINLSNPHPLFDTSYYYNANYDVKESGINPLWHFVEHGHKETRNPHVLFDVKYYYKQYPELKQKNINPIIHYIKEGAYKGINPHPLFNSAFYLKQYPEVVEAEVNPLIDYLEIGYKIPRDPNPFFDTYYYRYLDKNIEKNDLNPLIHYCQNALKHQNHNPNGIFENSHYINKYPDIPKYGLNPLAHFIEYGRFEGKTVGGRIEYAVNNTEEIKNKLLERNHWLSGHICIVSHEASRTGAPLIILKVVKWLVEKYKFKCTTVLLNGGEIVEDFKKYGKVYNIKDMGLSSEHLTSTIVATFLASIFKHQPLLTIVNSATSHQVCEGLHRLGFPYYCLTHEFADPYWPQQLNNMLKAQHVFVPSNIVKNSFERKDGIEKEYLSKISVLRQGVLTEEFGANLTKKEAKTKWIDELKQYKQIEIDNLKNNIEYNKKTVEELIEKNDKIDKFKIQELKIQIEKDQLKLEILNVQKDEIAISENTKIILGSGYAHGRKGIDLFYNVIINVLNKIPEEDLVFAWLGHYDDSNYNTIEYWINYDFEKTGLNKKVIFIGNKKQDEVDTYFKAADVFLLTSRMDPFPCVTLEAMACGLPVVGFDNATGSTEVIAGNDHTVFPYLNIEKISDGLIHLLNDAALRNEIGAKNYEIVEKDFAFETYVDQIVDFIEEKENLIEITNRKALIEGELENKKPKVIALCTDWGLSGVNSVLEAMGKQLIKEGIEFSILFSQNEDHVHKSAHGGDGNIILPELPFEYLKTEGFNIKDWWANLIGYYENNAPCILLTTFDFSGSSVIPALSNNVGAITWVQSDDPDYYEQTNRLGRYCNSIAVVSSYLKQSISSLNPLFSDTVSVVYNTTVFANEIVESREDIKTNKKLTMIYTGRLVQYQKRVLDFIDIVKELDKTGIDYQLTLAGQDTTGGEIEGKLKEVLSEHITDKRVILAGRLTRDKLFDELRKHDIFLLISDFEGMPLSLVEGMSQGCVPVVSDMKSGTKELVIDKKTGYVLTTRDYSKWVELLVELHQYRQKLYELSKSAISHIANNFTVEKSASRFSEIIKNIHKEISKGEYKRPDVIKAHNKTGDVLISQYLQGHEDLR